MKSTLLLASLITILLLTLLLPIPTIATITLANTGQQYHSRPASFGFNLEYGLQYVALLQVVDDDLHLCGGVTDVDNNGSKDDDDGGGDWMDGFNEGGIEEDHGIQQRFYDGRVDDQYHRGIDLFEEEDSNKLEEPLKDGEVVKRGLLRSAVSSPLKYMLVNNKGRVVDIDGGGGDGGGGGGGGEEDDPMRKEYERAKNSTETPEKKDIHVTPSHGVPVAILAKRGQCTYETKARVASQQTTPHGAVRFVIVYDNVERDGNHLITMMPKDNVDDTGEHRQHELWKDVGLVFVSYESGVDLHSWVNSQSRFIKAQGGPRILIDGSDHWTFPPMDESAAGMAFLLMLFGCVCSMSLFLNTTFGAGSRNSNDSIGTDHHLFFLGPDGQILERNGGGRNTGRGSSRRGNGLRLLTMEEVETLPTREYVCSSSSDEDETSPPSSPPSSSLELRDKSDMPYEDSMAATDLCHNNDDTTPNHRCGSGGGLCEALLPTKKEDPYFDQNTCSICLDEYEAGEEIRVLPCQHTFHSHCIFPWLTERSPTCPLCKAMFEAVQYEEDAAQDGEGADTDEASQVDDEEQQSVQTEASANAPSTSPSPPLEEEPPIHRRRQRQTDQSAAASSRNSNTIDETAVNEESNDRQSSSSSTGLRGRLWGMFNATVANDAGTSSSNNLEEPLLGSDADNVV